jgi:Tol biopolymer transport system component/tRNA A-37 threonylcarbamoyl transferase component Bud32
MDPARWARVEGLFFDALSQPASARAAFVDQVCGGDREMRADVESLLAAHEREIPPGLAASTGLIRAVLHAFESEYFLGKSVGRFRIDAYLGRGCSGIVFRAFDPGTADYVAVKVLSPELVADPGQRQAFENECAALAGLQCPRIVSILGVERFEDSPVLVMEYIPGRTLARVMAEGDAGAAQAVEWADQILEALDAAHAAGIAHGDLKASNIMVEESGQVRVLDFGLCRLTPGRTAEAGADIEAFGALLGELLPGGEYDEVVARCKSGVAGSQFGSASDVRVALARAQSRNRGRRVHLRVRWALTGLALAAVAGVVVDFTGKTPDAPPRLTQVTFEPGFSTTPAISPDSRVLAYAHDSGDGNGLDLWLRPVNGGAARRIVASMDDESYPTFSPDGGTLAFRSERGQGGIYRIRLGSAEGSEQLLAAGGYRPKYSPDGKWIAYWSAAEPATFRSPRGAVFVIPAGGGAPNRQAQEFIDAKMPVWTSTLLFLGQRRDEKAIHWWTTSLGGEPERVFFERERDAREFRFAGMSPEDYSLHRGIVTFSRFLGATVTIWQVKFDGRTGLLGTPWQVAIGTSHSTAPAVSAQGWLVAHIGTINNGIWALPAATEEGRATGNLISLTPDDAEVAQFDPAISPDGRLLSFIRHSAGPVHQVVRDLATQREWVSPADLGEKAKLLRSAAGPAFVRFDDRLEGSQVFLVRDSRSERIFNGIGVPTDIAPDGRLLLAESRTSPTSIVVHTRDGRPGQPVLEHPEWSLVQARLSPGRRWVAFAARDGRESRLYVAPFRNRRPVPRVEWISLGPAPGSHPAWSPGGRWLYFLSERDRFTCVWGQRMDPNTGAPVGIPSPIQHFHHFRFGFDAGPSRALGLSVARDKIVFGLTRLSGGLWMYR